MWTLAGTTKIARRRTAMRRRATGTSGAPVCLRSGALRLLRLLRLVPTGPEAPPFELRCARAGFSFWRMTRRSARQRAAPFCWQDC
jgi:hypothetical protein